jgi:oligoxyloglucan reducing-end-specific cellobiohydrolase
MIAAGSVCSPRENMLFMTVIILGWLQSAGATTKIHHYEFNSVMVTGGGYITGIVAHSREQNLFYVRTDIGSAYRWDVANDKWIALTDFISSADSELFGTESIGLDPTNSSWLYLAQGRYVGDQRSAFFVSQNQGRTFDIYESPFHFGSNDMGRNNGERLAVNPFNPGELWMGTRTAGLWKSTDRAKTWTNVTSFPNAFANGIGIVSVIFDPKHEGTLYACACAPGGMYESHDGGDSWAPIPGQPMTWGTDTVDVFPGYSPASTGPQAMKVALASNGILYVTYGDSPGPWGTTYGEVWRYNTSSQAWTEITPGRNGNSYPLPYKNQTFPAGGFCGLSLAGNDPETLVVATLDRDPGPALDSIYLSHDGGNTWKDIAQLSTPPGSGGYWGHPISQAALKDGTPVPWLGFNWGPEWSGYGAPSPVKGLTKMGWWMSALLLDPFNTNRLIYGTGATIWATDTLSHVDENHSPEWYVLTQGIEETVILALSSPTGGPGHILSGLGDINGFRHDDPTKIPNMFTEPVFSNLDSIDFAGMAPHVVVRVGVCGQRYPDRCGNAAYSTDFGDTWKMFFTCAPGVNASTSSTGSVVVDASGTHVIWSTLNNNAASRPWTTSDFGKTWMAPQGLDVQTANIAADRVAPGTFYAYESGVFYVSRDGGLTYFSAPAEKIGLPAKVGAAPVVNPFVAGELWVGVSGVGIFHSRNFGKYWTALKGNGNGLDPSLLAAGKGPTGNSSVSLFLWGAAGEAPLDVQAVYRSDDDGVSWVRVNDNAHQYGGISIIAADPRVYGRVYLGTGGRGLVYADIVPGAHNNVSGH